MTYLIIGLGNPGTGYSGNRHNIGFMALDKIINDYGFSKPSLKFGGSVSEGSIAGSKVYAFKPLGYMNISGGPASEIARFYKIDLKNTIAIHDDLDIAPGKLKVKRGGGSGGHNGLKSLDSHIGIDYLRIRVGIGHPGDKDMVSEYVLSNFRKEELPIIDSIIQETSRHIALLLNGDEAGFMNKVSLSLQ
ncbi:MAG: aminoacyl-tRNA hydrolase [Rickettsiales bacterium]